MDKFKDYHFHYNADTQMWAAYKEKDKDNYLSNDRSKQSGILYAKEVETLIDFIKDAQ